ncbi:MAG: peptide chain release factor N(5)-glutamine methyltransferase [Planktotalea sp.]|uniref:peptide chain release factor N(5)-glutamine methyltransferase n=1 Tax=Planktotalea sp. TaxID=2029877 RepID=UPI003C77D46F
MILQDLMLSLRQRLSDVPSDDVMRDLRILAAHALGIEPSRMTLHMHDQVSDDVRARLETLVQARARCTPISKIIQKRQFWGRSFAVDLNVLDPRGDTETLIAACLELGPQARVLDLGTGSGAIGLTLAAEWPGAKVVCTDISERALAVARSNMKAIEVEKTVTLIRSDWFETVSGQFDLIVSNPPYIALEEWIDLDVEVREFDPRIALTDEGDGLGAYRVLSAQAGAHLRDGARLIVEIGHQQGAAVQQLFEENGFTEIQCLQDMAGRDRVVCGIWAQKPR